MVRASLLCIDTYKLNNKLTPPDLFALTPSPLPRSSRELRTDFVPGSRVHTTVVDTPDVEGADEHHGTLPWLAVLTSVFCIH